MTVICVLFAETTPVVLTDVLISSNKWDGTALPTPLKLAENRTGLDGFGPAGLAQKAHDLGGGLNILYAGTVADAEKLIAAIGSKTMQGEYTMDIHERIKEIVRMEGLHVTFIALHGTADGEVAAFSSENVNVFYSENGYGKVLVAGSGAMPLIEFLEKSPAYPPSDNQPPPINVLDAALASTMGIAAILARDFEHPESVMARHSCGGHYEIVSPFQLVSPEVFDVSALLARAAIEIEFQMYEGNVDMLRVRITQRSVTQTAVHTFHGCVRSDLEEPMAFSNADWKSMVIGRTRDKSAISSVPTNGLVELGPVSVTGVLHGAGPATGGSNLIPAAGQSTGHVQFSATSVSLHGVTRYIVAMACRLLKERPA